MTLTDTSSAPFALQSRLTKPVSLVFFGYTNCPDVCTGIMTDMATVRSRMPADQRDKVDLVVITTDPARDTPSALRQYLDRIDPTFIGLTGDQGVIRQVADALGVVIDDAHPLPSGGYEVSHGAQVLGITGGRARVVWTPGTSIADMREDVRTLLAGR